MEWEPVWCCVYRILVLEDVCLYLLLCSLSAYKIWYVVYVLLVWGSIVACDRKFDACGLSYSVQLDALGS